MTENFTTRLKVETNLNGKAVTTDELRDANYQANQQLNPPQATLKAFAGRRDSGIEELKPKPGIKQIKRKRAEPKTDDAALRKAAETDLKKRNLKS
jgi:hypothetical protein